VREADNLTTFMCRMSWKLRGLNFQEPSGTQRACYGTALPYIYIYIWGKTVPVHPIKAHRGAEV